MPELERDPKTLTAANGRNGKRTDVRFATESELRELMSSIQPEDLDMESELFRSLPPDLQYELVGDMRAQSRGTSYRRLQAMLANSPTPIDFSKAQVAGLKTRNTLTQRVLTVTDEIGSANIKVPVRIAGERNREYVLVRNKNGEGGFVLGVRDAGSSRDKAIAVNDSATDESVKSTDEEDFSAGEMEMEEVDIPDAPREPSPDPEVRRKMAMDMLAARAERHARQGRLEDDAEERLTRPNRRPGEALLFIRSGGGRRSGQEQGTSNAGQAYAQTSTSQEDQIDADEAMDLARALEASENDNGNVASAPMDDGDEMEGFEFEDVDVDEEALQGTPRPEEIVTNDTIPPSETPATTDAGREPTKPTSEASGTSKDPSALETSAVSQSTGSNRMDDLAALLRRTKRQRAAGRSASPERRRRPSLRPPVAEPGEAQQQPSASGSGSSRPARSRAPLLELSPILDIGRTVSSDASVPALNLDQSRSDPALVPDSGPSQEFQISDGKPNTKEQNRPTTFEKDDGVQATDFAQTASVPRKKTPAQTPKDNVESTPAATSSNSDDQIDDEEGASTPKVGRLDENSSRFSTSPVSTMPPATPALSVQEASETQAAEAAGAGVDDELAQEIVEHSSSHEAHQDSHPGDRVVGRMSPVSERQIPSASPIQRAKRAASVRPDSPAQGEQVQGPQPDEELWARQLSPSRDNTLIVLDDTDEETGQARHAEAAEPEAPDVDPDLAARQTGTPSPEPADDDVEEPLLDNHPSMEAEEDVRPTDASRNLPAAQASAETDSDEGTPIEWSPSPSPGPVALGADGFPLPDIADLDALDAEDMEEQVAEMAADQNEFAQFLSAARGRNLDDVQAEIEKEVSELRAEHANTRRTEEDITRQMAREIQMMLRLFGLPYITAPMEAEAQCAELVSRKLVDGIITDDSDVFLFGGTRIYKNMFNNNKVVECFLLSDLDRELGLDREKLVRLAYLLGSDYTDGLPGVGPVMAMELLSLFGGRDGLLQFKEWWLKVQMGADTPADTRGKTMRRLKKTLKEKVHLTPEWPEPAVLDAYYQPAVDESEEPFQWGLPDLDSLRTFLGEYLRWPVTKTDQYLLPVIDKQNQRSKARGNQSTLDRNGFFDMTAGAGVYAGRKRPTYTSSRLQQVVNGFREAQRKSGQGSSGSGSGTAAGAQQKRRGRARGSQSGTSSGEDEELADSDDGFEVLGALGVPEEQIGKEMGKNRPIVRRDPGDAPISNNTSLENAIEVLDGSTAAAAAAAASSKGKGRGKGTGASTTGQSSKRGKGRVTAQAQGKSSKAKKNKRAAAADADAGGDSDPTRSAPSNDEPEVVGESSSEEEYRPVSKRARTKASKSGTSGGAGSGGSNEITRGRGRGRGAGGGTGKGRGRGAAPANGRTTLAAARSMSLDEPVPESRSPSTGPPPPGSRGRAPPARPKPRASAGVSREDRVDLT